MPDEIETPEMRERLSRSCCPFCGEGSGIDDRVTWDSPDVEGDQAWQAFACHACDRRGVELYLRVGFNEQSYDPALVETCYRAPEQPAPVWIVLRGFEGHVTEINADVFTNEAAAREHAERLGGPTWETDESIRVLLCEEQVATEAWAEVDA